MKKKNRIATLSVFMTAALLSCREPAARSTENTSAPVNTDQTKVPVNDSAVAASESTSPASDTMAARISDLLSHKLLKDDAKDSTATRLFVYGLADLNSDNQKEIFVLLHSSDNCGSGGCTGFLLSSTGERIARFTVSETPIAIAGSKTRGWNDLIISSRGQQYLVKYNGASYPGNPTVQPEYKGSMDSTQIIIPQNAVEHTY